MRDDPDPMPPERSVLTEATASVRARRPGRLAVLVASQLLAGVGVASGIAVGGVLAERMTGTTALAGLAQTCSVLGAGLWAIPLARLAQRRGRRWGLGAGYLLAVVGTLMVLGSVAAHVVPLLFVGFGCFGAATAAGLQARFAATELGSPAHRARAMSVVLWATTLGSVTGPNLSELGARLGRRLGIDPLTGPYLFSLAAFAGAALVIGIALRNVGPTVGPGSTAPPVRSAGLAETLRMIVGRPRLLVAVVAITCSHTVMVGVMVMTPVHMINEGFGLSLVGLVISIHILGMYGASPLFGVLTDTIRPRGVLVLAVLLFAAALLVAGWSGHARFPTMSLALGLLGLGWSAGMIGGSTLLTTEVPDDVRTSVQGVTDAIMNVAAAASSALSGAVMGWAGYPALAVIAAVVVAPMAVLVARSGARRTPA